MTETITRAHLAEAIHQQLGLPNSECMQMVDVVLDEICQGLNRDGLVKIAGFGTFSVREKQPRVGRNPKTKEEVMIDARRVLTFRPAAELRKDVTESE